MNDRELLDLAAKASGVEYEFDDYSGDFELITPIGGFSGVWNPITDDGDAFRLAVKLDIYFMVVREQGHVSARIRHGSRTAYNEKIKDDEYAATRRAIVRAAAEIGKAMP